MISLISLLEIINILVPYPNIFLWIAAAIADTVAVNRNSVKILLANDFNTFFLKGNPVFSNGFKSLPKNPPHCPIFCNWVFDNFLSADEQLAKALQSFETCILVNSRLCSLFSSLKSPTAVDDSFKVTSIPFLIPDFNLLSSALDNFTFKVLYLSHFILHSLYYIKTK